MVSRANLEPAVSQAVSIHIDLIKVGNIRLRSLKPAKAAAIGVAMDVEGQYEPIAICQLPGREDFELVDGLHRLEGARNVGWRLIDATIVSSNADERRRREILSEWVRANSDVFDRAGQIAAISAMARADKSIEQPNLPRDLAESTIIGLVLKWDEQTAHTLGISRQTIYNHLKIAETYDATWIARLRAIGHADQLVPLLLLAKQEFKIIAKVIAWLEAGHAAERPATIAEGIAAVLGNAKPTPEDKRFSAVVGNLARMGDPERRAAVDRIVSQYLTTEALEAILANRRANG